MPQMAIHNKQIDNTSNAPLKKVFTTQHNALNILCLSTKKKYTNLKVLAFTTHVTIKLKWINS